MRTGLYNERCRILFVIAVFRDASVGLTVFQALDKAIEAGGDALGGKDIAGTGKVATGLLGEMCSSGLLERSAAKTPKYTVTAEGRAAWERDAPEERRRQLERRERDRQRQALAEFLAAVQKKQGKALTKAELPRFTAAVRQEACDRKLVEAGPKENAYRLLPAGEGVLLSNQPAERQLERLRHLHREAAAMWRAAHQGLGRELDGPGGRALRVAAEGVAGRGAAALAAFDSALAELGGLAAVAEAAGKVRAEVEAASQTAHEAADAERVRLAGIEARLRDEVGRQREQLEAIERRSEAVLADVARRLEAAAEPTAAPSPAHGGTPPEAAAWKAAQAAHARIRQENLRIGGTVKVPELTDAVTQAVPGLPRAAFHELLKAWQQEDRLTLQLCNDPRLEPRAAEGIQSPRGLLFYVQMR